MQPRGTDLSEPQVAAGRQSAELRQTCSDICLLATTSLGVAGQSVGGCFIHILLLCILYFETIIYMYEEDFENDSRNARVTGLQCWSYSHNLKFQFIYIVTNIKPCT